MSKLAKIATTPGAVPTEYAIPTIADPHGLAVGPDGNLWFTEFYSNGLSIGRMTTSGVVQTFPVGAVSWRIVTGPDGNLWFSENESSGIGRITLTGTATSFPTPTQNSNMNGIAIGPNGTVWYTETGDGAAVGQITDLTAEA